MKSGTAVGTRTKPIEKEPTKPSNADMVYKSGIVVKDGPSTSMALPTAKPSQLQKKELAEQELQSKREQAYVEKMKKIEDTAAAKAKIGEKDEKVPVKPVDAEKKSKMLNQKKIEELQKKLFDVQIRLKNSGRKVN